MFKVFKTEIITLKGSDKKKKETTECIDSFSRECSAESFLNELYEKERKCQIYENFSFTGKELSFCYQDWHLNSKTNEFYTVRYHFEEFNTVMNGENEVDVSSLDYDFIDDFHFGRAIVRSGDRWGVIDEQLELVFMPREYKCIKPYEIVSSRVEEPVAMIEFHNNKQVFRSYIDIHGNFLIKAKGFLHRIPSEIAFWAYPSETRWVLIQIDSPAEIEKAEDFDDTGEYTFYDVERCTYMKYGNYVGPDMEYVSADVSSCCSVGGFEGDVARIKCSNELWLTNPNRYGLIDSSERIIVDPKYEELRPFSDNLAAFKTIAEYKYERISPSRWKKIPLGEGAKWGFINKSGKEVIPPKYDMVHSFSAGHASFNLGGTVVVMNPIIPSNTPPEMEWIYDDIPPIKMFCGGKWGIINDQGYPVIPAEYDWISEFIHGKVAIVKKNRKYGLISANLSAKTSLEYDYIEHNEDTIRPDCPCFSCYKKEYDENCGEELYKEYYVYLQSGIYVVTETGDAELAEDFEKIRGL